MRSSKVHAATSGSAGSPKTTGPRRSRVGTAVEPERTPASASCAGESPVSSRTSAQVMERVSASGRCIEPMESTAVTEPRSPSTSTGPSPILEG